MYKKHDLSYLAGLIDGDGTIGVHSRGGGKTRFVIELRTTSHIQALWLSATFGGAITYYPKEKIATATKDQWRWRVSGSAAGTLYAKLYPYLRIKRLV